MLSRSTPTVTPEKVWQTLSLLATEVPLHLRPGSLDVDRFPRAHMHTKGVPNAPLPYQRAPQVGRPAPRPVTRLTRPSPAAPAPVKFAPQPIYVPQPLALRPAAAAAEPVVQWLESTVSVQKKSKSKHKRRPKKLRQHRKETPRRRKTRKSPTKVESDEENPLDFTKPQVRPTPAPWKAEMPLEGANTPVRSTRVCRSYLSQLRSNLSRYSSFREGDPLENSFGYNRDPLSSSYGFRDTLGSMGFGRDSLRRASPSANRLGRRDPTGSSSSFIGSPTEVWRGSPDVTALLRSMNELESFIADYNKINLCPRGRWFTLKSYLIVVNNMRSVQRSMRLYEPAALGEEVCRRYAKLRMAVASVVAVAEIRLDRSQPSLDPDYLDWSQWLQDSCRRILADSQRDIVPAAVPSTFLVREMQQRGTQSPVVGAVTSVLQAALEALESTGFADRDMAQQASELKDRVDVLLIRLRRSSGDDPGLEPIVNLKRRCDAFCLEGAAPFGVPEDATLRERLRRGGLRVVTDYVQTLTASRQRALSAAELPLTKQMEAKITELQTAQKLHNYVSNRFDFSRESDAMFAEATFKLQEFTISVISWWCKQAGNAMEGGARWETPDFDQQRKLLMLAGESIRGLCAGRPRLPTDYFLGYLTFKDLSVRMHHRLGPVQPATLLLEGNALSSEAGATLALSSEAQLKLSEGSLTMADFMREVISSQEAQRIYSVKGSSYPVLTGDQVSWADRVLAMGCVPHSGLTSVESGLLVRAGRLFSKGVNVTPGSTSASFIDQAAAKWLRDFVQSTGEKSLLPQEESLLELISLANEIAQPEKLPTNNFQLLRSICEALKRRLQRQFSKFWTAHRQKSESVTVETVRALASSIADFVATYPDLLRSAQGRSLCRLLLDAKAVMLRVPSGELHDAADLIHEAFREQGLLTERQPDHPVTPAHRADVPIVFVEPINLPRASLPVSLWKNRCSFDSVQKVLSTTPLHELTVHHSSPLFRYVMSVKKPKHVQQLVSALEDPWQRTAEHLRTARARAESSYTEIGQKIDAMSQYLSTLLGAGQLHSLLTAAIGLLKSKSTDAPALLDPLLAFRKLVARSLREDVTILNPQRLPTFFQPVLPNDADKAGLGAATSAVNAAEFDEEDESQGMAKTMLVEFLSFCSPVDAKSLGAEALVGHLVRLSALFRALSRILATQGSCLLLDASFHGKQGSVEAIEQTEVCGTVKGIAEHLTRQLLTLIGHEPPPEAVKMLAATSMPAVDVSLKRQLRSMLSAPLAMRQMSAEDRQLDGTT